MNQSNPQTRVSILRDGQDRHLLMLLWTRRSLKIQLAKGFKTLALMLRQWM